MNELEYDSDRLSAEQILGLLEVSVESPAQMEFHRLMALPSRELLQKIRAKLEHARLGVDHAAQLIATNELTMKNWFRSSKPLPEAAHQKLAALYLVLVLAGEDPAYSEAVQLSQAVVSAVRHNRLTTISTVSNEWNNLFLTAFGVVGLAAAALHSALISARPHSLPQV